jgi:hypothetical protein
VVELLSVLEELRFSSTGISQKKAVDISSDSMFTVDVLSFTTEHG